MIILEVIAITLVSLITLLLLGMFVLCLAINLEDGGAE